MWYYLLSSCVIKSLCKVSLVQFPNSVSLEDINPAWSCTIIICVICNHMFKVKSSGHVFLRCMCKPQPLVWETRTYPAQYYSTIILHDLITGLSETHISKILTSLTNQSTVTKKWRKTQTVTTRSIIAKNLEAEKLVNTRLIFLLR